MKHRRIELTEDEGLHDHLGGHTVDGIRRRVGDRDHLDIERATGHHDLHDRRRSSRRGGNRDGIGIGIGRHGPVGHLGGFGLVVLGLNGAGLNDAGLDVDIDRLDVDVDVDRLVGAGRRCGHGRVDERRVHEGDGAGVARGLEGAGVRPDLGPDGPQVFGYDGERAGRRLERAENALVARAQLLELRPRPLAPAGEIVEHALAHGARLGDHLATLGLRRVDGSLGLGRRQLPAVRGIEVGLPPQPRRVLVGIAHQLGRTLLGASADLAGAFACRREHAHGLLAERSGHRRIVEHRRGAVGELGARLVELASQTHHLVGEGAKERADLVGVVPATRRRERGAGYRFGVETHRAGHGSSVGVEARRNGDPDRALNCFWVATSRRCHRGRPAPAARRRSSLHR